MARLTFKPSINWINIDRSPELLITAEHSLRESLYWALSSIDDVLYLSSSGNTQTQFRVRAHNGYTARQAYFLTVVFFYSMIEMQEKSLEEFWGLSIAEHMVSLAKGLELPVEEPAIVANEMLEGLVLLIPGLANKQLEKHLERELRYVDSSQFNNFKVFLNEMTESARRLEYIDRARTFITLEEWQRRKLRIAQIAFSLQEIHNAAVLQVDLIKAKKSNARDFFKSFDFLVESISFDYDELLDLLTQYCQIKTAITQDKEEMLLIQAGLKEKLEEAEKLYVEGYKLSPPEVKVEAK